MQRYGAAYYTSQLVRVGIGPQMYLGVCNINISKIENNRITCELLSHFVIISVLSLFKNLAYNNPTQIPKNNSTDLNNIKNL